MYIDRRDLYWDEYKNQNIDHLQEFCMCIPGLYIVWCAKRGFCKLEDRFDIEKSKEYLFRLDMRSISPAQFCDDYCNGKLSDDDFTDLGLQFTNYYYHNFYQNRFPILLNKNERNVEKQREIYDELEDWINETYEYWSQEGCPDFIYEPPISRESFEKFSPGEGIIYDSLLSSDAVDNNQKTNFIETYRYFNEAQKKKLKKILKIK